MMIQLIQHKDLKQTGMFLQRPYANDNSVLENVRKILDSVKTDGDKAIKQFTLEFDKVELDLLFAGTDEIKLAASLVSDDLKSAIELAYENICKFHLAQKTETLKMETMPGVHCMRKPVPINRVGIYIPGGSAPLFSTFLMLAIPAKIAGCPNISVFTPCSKDGQLNPVIAYIADFLEIKKVYKIGGAQAIAAMAYGTESIEKVDKIFGPGNQYVTTAKQLVQASGTAIDMPAGPSEVLVIADKNANPDFIAADLLSQAEHGADSQVVLISDDATLFPRVESALDIQIQNLDRKAIVALALEHCRFVKTETINEAIKVSNAYAPEHLILNVVNAESYIEQIQNAGSVFLGAWSPESVGDYASGTNHTLPTNGYANAYSGVSLNSFVKKITFQQLSEKGIYNIGNAVIEMAKAEGLQAHANAVKLRLEAIK
jgi:histidinol dehydrogenase